MEYIDAFRLFNLNKNFTREELEKKYNHFKLRYKDKTLSKNRFLIVKEAYSLLLKQYYKNKRKFELNKLKIIEEIKKQYAIYIETNDKDFNYYYNNECSIIQKGLINIENSTTVEEITKIIGELSKKIENNNISFYYRYIEKYKEAYKIPSDIIYKYRKEIEKVPNVISTYQITYDLVNSFKNREKSIEEKTEGKLNSIIEKFKDNENFEYIETIVIKLKEKAKKQILIDQNILDIVIYDKFRSDISYLLKIYNKKDLDLYKVNKLENKMNRYNQNKLFNLSWFDDISKLINHAGNNSFDLTYKTIVQKITAEFIESELEKININEITSLIQKKYNYIVNDKKIKVLIKSKEELKFVENLSYLLEKIRKNQLTLRQIELIKILFSNLLFDKELLTMILYGEDLNHDIIFLEKNPSQIETKVVKVEDISEDSISYIDEDKKESKISSFKKEYMSLLDFLEEAKYIGKKVILYNKAEFILLYQNIDYSLIYNKEKDEFIIINNFNVENNQYKIGEDVEIDTKLKDRYYVYNEYVNRKANLYIKEEQKVKKHK